MTHSSKYVTGSLALLALALVPRADGVAQTPIPLTPAIERRIDSLVNAMTLAEKIRMLAGVNGFDAPGVARLSIPQLSAADSPFGVRATGPSTLYAGGIGLAATWNPELAERVGAQIGRDARARGKHYSLGPGVNIYRSPLSGRNFEYYGEDPFLASRVVVGFIRGMQAQGVSATVKHFMGNNSEFARNTTDSRIDERTMREIYLPAFEAAVKDAQVGAIMGSYNLTNGFFMTENRHLITDVVKGEWGFPGVYMSDWYATHNAVAAANAGTDLEMPEDLNFNAPNLTAALQQGKVTQATIDEKLRRLVRNSFRFGWMEHAQPDRTIPRYSIQGREVALQSAREAIVLLKNDRRVLPLDRAATRTVAIIGPNAYPAVVLGGGSATIPTYNTVSTLEGIANYLGTSGRVDHVRGIPSLAKLTLDTRFSTTRRGDVRGIVAEVFRSREASGAPASTRVDQHVSLGVPLDMAVFARDDAGLEPQPDLGPPGPIATRWTGFYDAQRAGTYDFVVQQGGFNESGFRLFVDDTLVRDRWTFSPAVVEPIPVRLDGGPHKVVLEYHSVVGFSTPFVRFGIVRQGSWVSPDAITAARGADVAVVAVGFDPQTETENWDRTFHLPPGQDELIRAIVDANPRTIVVINSGGATDMTDWIDQVPAVIQAWYLGQEGGAALAEILFGAVNPSGHLPATFEKRWQDNPSFASYYPDSGTNRIYYREGVFVGYRGFDQRATAPRFAFGHGLSYTTFRFSNLVVTQPAGSTDAAPRWVATFDVTNTGARAGAAVPQLYVHEQRAQVPRPPKELKGLAKVVLAAGETKSVSLPLDMRSLAYYDTTTQQWRANAGSFDILIGSSSADADLTLRGALVLRRTVTAK